LLGGAAAYAMLAVALLGCRGKKVATVSLTGAGKASTTFTAGQKPLSLWADTDAKWHGSKGSKPELTYTIDFTRDGKPLGSTTCSTKEVGAVFCGVHSTVGGTHDADCEMRLGCGVPALGAGPVEIAVTGAVGPNVKSVKMMSINVREE